MQIHHKFGAVRFILTLGLAVTLAVAANAWNKSPFQVLISGAFTTMLLIGIGRVELKQLAAIEQTAKAQRGRPTTLADTFCPGVTVKVLAVSRDKFYAILQEYHGVKLVRLPENADLGVGKHYQLDKEFNFRDLIKFELTSEGSEGG